MQKLEQLFPVEISLSARPVWFVIFNVTQEDGRKGKNERNAEIDGEACEGGRKVEQRQCGAISAEKMGQLLFCICIRGVGHRFAATRRLVVFIAPVGESGLMDARAVCHFVLGAIALRAIPLKRHTHTHIHIHIV